MYFKMPGESSPTKTYRSLQTPQDGHLLPTENHATPTELTNTCNSEISENKIKLTLPNWTVEEVGVWARSVDLSNEVINCLENEKIDGGVLLALCEDDIRYIFDMRHRLNYQLPYGDLKKLWLLINDLQRKHERNNKKESVFFSSPYECLTNAVTSTPNDISLTHQQNRTIETSCCQHVENKDAQTICSYFQNSDYALNVSNGDSEMWTPSMTDGCVANIPPEFFKTFISLAYSFLVTWITSFVMVIVHERVPDMKRYPPLPDIFLDNVPHIPWAFHMCEITGTLLFAIWCCVCIFHKYRMVLLRRFFALAGTVFLLRCVTMLITSLSVPGTHLQCDQSDYAVDDTELSITEALELRISRAYIIWSGLGMSIQGVRTCGDYMFSGHTVALTLLNFFITEYTPRNLYFLHTLTWLLNMFGIFFILAAHEHYSIDVFVAFYITSRLFLYYHTLANNQTLMSRDSTRTRIWFPMFSYFESSVAGIIPNEYDTITTLLDGLLRLILEIKDACMMTAQRFSVDPPHLALATKNLLLLPGSRQLRHAATSTSSTLAATTTNCRAPTSTSSPVDDENGIQAATVHFEIASGNAKGDVTFFKSTSLSSKAFSNHNNNISKAGSPHATASASAEKKEPKPTGEHVLNLKTKVDSKKQL